MKKLSLLIAVLVFATSLSAQSLAELAKREKARREALGGRRAAVITSADLSRVKKRPAVEVAPLETGSGEETAAEASTTEPATVPDETEPVSTPSGSGAPSNKRITPAVAPNGAQITGEADRDQAEAGGTLEARLKAAQDLVDLLTTKMNALRQQFESQDAMVPGYVIQQQMDETNRRLLKAQAQQARIEAQMGKTSADRKPPAEAGR